MEKSKEEEIRGELVRYLPCIARRCEAMCDEVIEVIKKLYCK